MSVLLEHDSTRTLQSHLDELTWRTTLIFATVAVFTLVWSMYVDEVLNALLTMLQPCVGDCLNVYDPAQWSAVRWLTCVILGVFSALPLVLVQLLKFSKPGMLPSEYTAFKRWLTITTLVLGGGTFLLIADGLPMLYEFGFQQHRAAGLSAQYSAVDMLLVAAFCIWGFFVFIATWNAIASLGFFNILNADTADYWRLRIYGLGSLLLVLSIPEHAASLLLPLLATYWTTSELIGQRWYLKEVAVFGSPSVRLDGEGRRRKVAMVDCSCEGANTHHGHALVAGCSTVDVRSLCTDGASRTRLIEHALQSAITDVVITGCDTKACPSQFLGNMKKLDIAVHGLNLMSLQNIRVDSPHPDLDVHAAFLTLPTLFPQHLHENMLRNLIEKKAWLHGPLPVVKHETPPTWGTYHSTEGLVLPPVQSRAL